MSDLDKLREMDPEEVQKKTYIAPKVLKALLDGDFQKLGLRAKAIGLVNILERELHLNLKELRNQIEEFYGNNESVTLSEKRGGEESEGGSQFWLFGILLLLLAAVGGGYYYYTHLFKTPDRSSAQQGGGGFFISSQSSEESSKEKERGEERSSSSQVTFTTSSSLALNTSSTPAMAPAVEKGGEKEAETGGEKEESSPSSDRGESLSSSSSSLESSSSLAQSEESSSSQEARAPERVVIIPREKLWLGIIYLDNFKRKQYLTSNPIELDTSRDQLIVTGHGLITIQRDDREEVINERGKQRFIYRNGVLEKIDAKQFREYNRGRNW
ncbi:MAG: helix-turn-helix domain-containing protein [Epsilonproteobacteria bacterium]|nr:hypothetical protein [Campylobacterota bacterium]NPA56783.1 helix-turn-helix domain-containing protein [Campylobacterota bacterium]